MFGDGKKGKIQRIGSIDRSEQSSLINDYMVEGLKSNLISITQLFDEGLMVMFTKTECKAVDEKENVILSGIRTRSNCYMWRATEMVEPISQETIGQNSSQLQTFMVEEVIELSKSRVWKPRSYLNCLQCYDDMTHERGRSGVTQSVDICNLSEGNCLYQLTHEYQLSVTGELLYFLGSQKSSWKMS